MDVDLIVFEQPGIPGNLRLKLLTGKIVVGRAPACDLVLNDVSVSRFHAEILIDEHAVRVRDLKSRNGTFVAGQLVEESTVALGERRHVMPVEYLRNLGVASGRSVLAQLAVVCRDRRLLDWSATFARQARA